MMEEGHYTNRNKLMQNDMVGKGGVLLMIFYSQRLGRKWEQIETLSLGGSQFSKYMFIRGEGRNVDSDLS